MLSTETKVGLHRQLKYPNIQRLRCRDCTVFMVIGCRLSDLYTGANYNLDFMVFELYNTSGYRK